MLLILFLAIFFASMLVALLVALLWVALLRMKNRRKQVKSRTQPQTPPSLYEKSRRLVNSIPRECHNIKYNYTQCDHKCSANVYGISGRRHPMISREEYRLHKRYVEAVESYMKSGDLNELSTAACLSVPLHQLEADR